MNLDELKGNTNVQNMKSAIHKLEENICVLSSWHKIKTPYGSEINGQGVRYSLRLIPYLLWFEEQLYLFHIQYAYINVY